MKRSSEKKERCSTTKLLTVNGKCVVNDRDVISMFLMGQRSRIQRKKTCFFEVIRMGVSSASLLP